MKNKFIVVTVIAILIVIVTIVVVVNKKKSVAPSDTNNAVVDLPINTIPLVERPFITLSPDGSGRSLDIRVFGAPKEGSMEYEMIYNASGKQEGALGSIFLGSEQQPILKSILLGSKSGGGKITYHEGVTGGSITLTYAKIRLKESWNYLHFDPTDPVISSTDGRFSATLGKTALKKDAVIVTMKTFGLPAEVLTKEGYPGKVIVGPYGYFTQTPIKGTASVELKLPAGEHINPTLYGWDGKVWTKLKSTLTGDTLSAPTTSQVFLVTAE